jgi:hypothetical protein
MKLLELDRVSNEVIPSPFLLEVEEFRIIWERDKSKGKAKAKKEIAYIYFTESLERDNPYTDMEGVERERKVVKDVFGGDFTPDKEIRAACDKLSQFYKSTFSYKYFRTSLEAAENLRDYLENVNYSERTKSEGMVHDPKKVQTILMDTRKTLTSLKELRDAVINESYEQDKLVADRTRNFFED